MYSGICMLQTVWRLQNPGTCSKPSGQGKNYKFSNPFACLISSVLLSLGFGCHVRGDSPCSDQESKDHSENKCYCTCRGLAATEDCQQAWSQNTVPKLPTMLTIPKTSPPENVEGLKVCV